MIHYNSLSEMQQWLLMCAGLLPYWKLWWGDGSIFYFKIRKLVHSCYVSMKCSSLPSAASMVTPHFIVGRMHFFVFKPLQHYTVFNLCTHFCSYGGYTFSKNIYYIETLFYGVLYSHQRTQFTSEGFFFYFLYCNCLRRWNLSVNHIVNST